MKFFSHGFYLAKNRKATRHKNTCKYSEAEMLADMKDFEDDFT
jgi:hypothetical protein